MWERKQKERERDMITTNINNNSNDASTTSSLKTRTCYSHSIGFHAGPAVSSSSVSMIFYVVALSMLLSQPMTLAFLNGHRRNPSPRATKPLAFYIQDSECCNQILGSRASRSHGLYNSGKTCLYSYNDPSQDSNTWISADDTYENISDWEEQVAKRMDGSLWSSFETVDNDDSPGTSASANVEVDDGEVWLDTLSSIAAEEIEFINTEADRADKVRQMQEWGFESETIEKALGVAVNDKNEIDKDNMVFEKFKKETAKTGFGMYLDDEVDKATVESHVSLIKIVLYIECYLFFEIHICPSLTRTLIIN
jgi:hypothetical protein